jgi:hypothetical protein
MDDRSPPDHPDPFAFSFLEPVVRRQLHDGVDGEHDGVLLTDP